MEPLSGEVLDELPLLFLGLPEVASSQPGGQSAVTHPSQGLVLQTVLEGKRGLEREICLP